MATVNLFQNEAIGTLWISELCVGMLQSIIEDYEVVEKTIEARWPSRTRLG